MIIFIYGEDTFRSRKKLAELKEHFRNKFDPSGESLTAIDGETASLEKIGQAVGHSSLFSSKRMIIVESVLANKSGEIFENLVLYLKEFEKKKNKDDNIIIFWEEGIGEKEGPKKKTAAPKKSRNKKDILLDFLLSQKFIYPFKPLSNTETIDWIKNEAKAKGGQIAGEAATLLSSFLGNDLWQADNELEKLINFKTAQQLRLGGESKGMITEEDVKDLVRGQFDERIFALTDAISNKNKKEAIRLLEEQAEAGLADAYLLSMIERQFKILAQVKKASEEGLTSRKIMSLFKLHPFVADKAIAQARRFTLESLKNIMDKLIEIDYLLKRGEVDGRTALGVLIGKEI